MRKFHLLLLLAFLLGNFSLIFSQQWGYATLIPRQNQNSVQLLDTSSNIIKQWSSLSGSNGYSAYLTEGGFLWRTVRASSISLNGGGVCGRVQKLAWDGTLLFDYTVSDVSQVSHHDICPMPNGNVILIVYEVKTAAQVQAAGATVNAVRWTEKLVELKPTGLNTAQIVWQWNLWDHLAQNLYPTKANYQTSILDHPELLNINYKNTATDWVHMNGIDYNAELDQIVVSSHNLNEMWVIDHSTTTAQAATHAGGNSGKGGDFLYRWGNPAAYGATGTTVFNVMHDAHWVPADCPRAGWLCGFNNRGVSSSQSAVDLFQTSWNGSTYTQTPGQAFPPVTYGYRHAATGYTSNMGSSQQLPNGNMLICLATAGRVYEINAAGTTLWEYTATGSIPQSKRYSRCFIENPKITVATPNPSICSGSSTQLDISVAATNTTNFLYNWGGGSGISNPNTQDPTIAGIVASTTYTVTVTTSPGCTVTASIPVNVSAPVADAGADVSIVAGQSTILIASGGAAFQWSSGENTASITVSPTATTTYFVTVTDASGCTATDAVTVEVTAPIFVQANASNPAFCLGGSSPISLSTSGGTGNLTFSWSSVPAGFSSNLQNPSVSPTENTTYFVQVSDGTSAATASISITVHPLPIASAGANANIIEGQSTVLTASGGTSFNWNTGAILPSITVAPTLTTTFSVTVFDANGCSASDEVTVTVSPKVSIWAAADKTEFCAGGTAQLSATAANGTGNFNYSWTSQPAGFFSNLQNPTVLPTENTTYFVEVSDGVGAATASVSIAIFALPTANAGSDLIISIGQMANLTADGGSIFQWNTGENTPSIEVQPAQTTTYFVTVTNANGCSATDAVTVVVTGTPLAATIDFSKNTICMGENVELNAAVFGGTGNFNFEWSAGGTAFSSSKNVVVSPSQSTTYFLKVDDGISTVAAEISIEVLPLPLADAGNDQSILIGTTATLTASGGSVFQWSTGENTASIEVAPLATTTYFVTVAGANGCTATDAVAIEVTGTFVNASPTASAAEICAGANVQLFANPAGGTGNYIFEWSAGGKVVSTEQNPTVQLSETTTFTLKIADSIKDFSVNLEVKVNALPIADAGDDQTILIGKTATLTATGGSIFQWNTGENTATIQVSPVETTIFTVTVTDENSCSASDQTTITVLDLLPLEGMVAASPTTICLGDALQISASADGGTGNYQFSWTSEPTGFASALPDPFINPEQTTTYFVEISDGLSKIVRSVKIIVNPLPQTPTVSVLGNILTSSSPTKNQWFFYGNAIVGATGQVFEPTQTGSYQVQIVDANGCFSPLSDPVEVVFAPLEATISASATVVCLGDVLQLFASASGGTGNYQFSWTSEPAGFSSSLPDPFVNPELPTTYFVQISDGSNTLSRSIKITVNPLPQQPAISVLGNILTSSSASNNQWFFYGNPIAGATGQVFEVAQTGSYQVQIVDANGCFSPLSEPIEVIIVSAPEILSDEKWTLAPNPASDFMQLLGDFGGSSFSIEIFNSAGQMLRRELDLRTVSLADLPAGVFWVCLKTEFGAGFKKLIVSRF